MSETKPKLTPDDAKVEELTIHTASGEQIIALEPRPNVYSYVRTIARDGLWAIEDGTPVYHKVVKVELGPLVDVPEWWPRT